MRKKGILIICTVCLIIITVGYSIKNGGYFLKKLADSKLPNNTLVEAKESSEDLLTGELSLKDFEIMGINLGQTVDEVKQILGEPECILDTVIFANNNKDDYKRYIYSGIELEIFLPQMKVTDISIPMTGYKTSRGIHVGDSREKIIKTYGDKYNASIYKGKDQIVYHYFEVRKDPIYGDDIYFELCLHFVLENDIVTEIKIYHAWD